MKITHGLSLFAVALLISSTASQSVKAGESAAKAAEAQAIEAAKIQQREAALIQAKKQEELNALAAQQAANGAKGNALYREELQKHALEQQAVKENVLNQEKAAQFQAAEGAAIRNAEQVKEAEKSAEWAARHHQ